MTGTSPYYVRDWDGELRSFGKVERLRRRNGHLTSVEWNPIYVVLIYFITFIFVKHLIFGIRLETIIMSTPFSETVVNSRGGTHVSRYTLGFKSDPTLSTVPLEIGWGKDLVFVPLEIPGVTQSLFSWISGLNRRRK